MIVQELGGDGRGGKSEAARIGDRGGVIISRCDPGTRIGSEPRVYIDGEGYGVSQQRQKVGELGG